MHSFFNENATRIHTNAQNIVISMGALKDSLPLHWFTFMHKAWVPPRTWCLIAFCALARWGTAALHFHLIHMHITYTHRLVGILYALLQFLLFGFDLLLNQKRGIWYPIVSNLVPKCTAVPWHCALVLWSIGALKPWHCGPAFPFSACAYYI